MVKKKSEERGLKFEVELKNISLFNFHQSHFLFTFSFSFDKHLFGALLLPP